MHARVGILQGRFLEHLHRGLEGLAARAVEPRGFVRRVFSHAVVVFRQVGEHPGGPGQRLHAHLERGERRVELQLHGLGLLRLPENQLDTVVIQPLLVFLGQPPDEREVRFPILADVPNGLVVFGLHLRLHARLPAQLLDNLAQRAPEPRVAALAVLQQVGGGIARHADMAAVQVLPTGVHLRDDPDEQGRLRLPPLDLYALAQPFRTVFQGLGRHLEVQGELKAVMVVDGLVQPERLE